VNFPEPFHAVLQRLREALARAEAWANQVPRPAPGGSIPDAAPSPPPTTIVSALHEAVAAFSAAGRPAYATVCAAAAAAAQRLASEPALVTAEAAAALQRALIGVLASAENPQATPQALFPVYRAVQHLAGAERIHPADLWDVQPDWRALPSEPFVPPRPCDASARADVEAALLALMRQPGTAACAQMSDLCAGLGEGQGGRLSTLWKLAAAVYDAQRAQRLKADVYLKRLGPRLLGLARGIAESSQTLDLLLRDLLYHCAHAEAAEDDTQSPRLDAVQRIYGFEATPLPADPPPPLPMPPGPPAGPAIRAMALADAVPGLPAAGDLDLSDLEGWSEPAEPAEPRQTAEPGRPTAAPGSGPTLAASAALAPVPPAPRRAASSDPVEAHFAALERGCTAAEEAIAALRRHLGATQQGYEPGSDPVIADGVRLALDAAAVGITTVTRTAQALRAATESLRKVRFDALTGRLHEHVGRVARESARPVRWALYGGSEAVDRVLLDRVAAPVEQLLRLSVEHGIEPAAFRQQAGKQAAGYVEVRVSRHLEGLAIDVSDDGAPLEVEHLRSEARRLGLPDPGPLIEPPALSSLLGRPGFGRGDDADNASPTMRRAAGWARAHTQVHALGGRLELPPDSAGRTTVRIALPG
jgi:chemotaxis protein histidine kinase CheA